MEMIECDKVMDYYDTQPDYARQRVRTLINNLCTTDEESRNYCITICLKCRSVEPGFIKGSFSKSSKQMLRCPVYNKCFVVFHGQLTYYSHQNSDKLDELTEDTFAQVPLMLTA